MHLKPYFNYLKKIFTLFITIFIAAYILNVNNKRLSIKNKLIKKVSKRKPIFIQITGPDTQNKIIHDIYWFFSERFDKKSRIFNKNI
jgi:hypothetical protein